MGIMSVGAKAAIRLVKMVINSAESSSRLDANAMSKGTAVCEEFCETVESGARILERNDYTLEEIEEIKCQLSIAYFTPLMERMVSIGYCCTQVQKDLDQDRCTAWFEPASEA
tara:strand:+ start:141 stop:479 length:339 start_codon:yes stop_codon:yes gene_type:complete